MSAPIYYTHTRTLRPIHTFAPIDTHGVIHKHTIKACTHFLSSPVTINVVFLLLTFLGFFFASLRSIPPCHSIRTVRFLSSTILLSLSAVSTPLSFFTSLSLPILHLFLSLPIPRPPYLALSAPLLSLLYFFTCLSPYPAGNNSISVSFLFHSSSHLCASIFFANLKLIHL